MSTWRSRCCAHRWRWRPGITLIMLDATPWRSCSSLSAPAVAYGRFPSSPRFSLTSLLLSTSLLVPRPLLTLAPAQHQQAPLCHRDAQHGHAASLPRRTAGESSSLGSRDGLRLCRCDALHDDRPLDKARAGPMLASVRLRVACSVIPPSHRHLPLHVVS